MMQKVFKKKFNIKFNKLAKIKTKSDMMFLDLIIF